MGLRRNKINILTWLHISDLHFRTSQAYNANVVLQALLRDIADRIRDDGLQPDLIAITGDIAFSGQPAEYAMARMFFDDLQAKTGLSRDRLFVVPGNHDIDRKLVDFGAKAIGVALTDRNKANELLASAGGSRQVAFARFKGYAEFVNDYFAGHFGFDDERHFYVHILNLAGQQIALLGLNSAWQCSSDQDKAEGLLVGEYQARTALEQAQDADLKIALLHHPFDWLREFDQNDSAAMLIDGCDFILNGHLHRTAATQLISPDSDAMILSSGACYETRDFPNMYNWVQLDLATRTGTVYLRRYSDARGGFWVKDTLTYKNVPDGIYKFALRGALVGPARPAHAAPQRQPSGGVSIGNVTGGIHDSIIAGGNVNIGGQTVPASPKTPKTEATPKAETPPPVLTRLHNTISKHFDDEELRTLCFRLGVDYDSLRAEGKNAKARELVAHMERTGRSPELVAECRKFRPHVAW